MRKLLLSFLLAPLLALPAAAFTVTSTPNANMVENVAGTDPNGNICYKFQTNPSCATTISISSSAIAPGSTNYIQNTLTPTTTTQQFSVLSGSFTARVDASTANIRNALLLNSSAGTLGQVITSNGPGVPPTYSNASSVSLSSTNTWTGAQTFTSSTTLSGPVLDKNLSAGTSGQVLTSQGNNAAPLWAGGRIIAITAPAASGAAATTTSLSYVGVSTITYTPKFAGSTIVIIATGLLSITNPTAATGVATLERNGTNLAAGATPNLCATSDDGFGTTSEFDVSCTMFITDTPNTTSAVNYAVYIKAVNGGTAKWNQGPSATNGGNFQIIEIGPTVP